MKGVYLTSYYIMVLENLCYFALESIYDGYSDRQEPDISEYGEQQASCRTPQEAMGSPEE